MDLKGDYGISLRFWKPIVKKRKIVIIRRKIRWNKKFNGGYFWCQGTEAISENMFFFEEKKPLKIRTHGRIKV